MLLFQFYFSNYLFFILPIITTKSLAALKPRLDEPMALRYDIMNIKPHNNYSTTFHSIGIGACALTLSMLSATFLTAEVVIDIDFEDLASGTLSSASHPGWEGMLADNQADQDPSDWEIEEGAGLTWIGPDGGTIDGGNKHLDMRSVSNITGRAFFTFEDPLPTDIGEATSIYLRYLVSFDQFEWISQLSTGPDDPRSVWPLVRFNSSWQMRSVLKWQEHTSAEQTEIGFMFELHDDVDLASGERSIVRLEDKLGQPQPMTTYLVVTRYDFDDLGVLQGQAAWVNPAYADGTTPDLESNHQQPGYDTFVNPIVSLDITTYGGTVRYDNIRIADSWDDVVPQPGGGGTTWAGFDVDGNSNADTMNWLGLVYVRENPWIYIYSLGKYVYLPESIISTQGAWMFTVK